MLIRIITAGIFLLTAYIDAKYKHFKGGSYDTVPALGRPFELGCLYDKKNNQIVGGGSVIPWSQTTMKYNTISIPFISSESDIYTTKNVESKMQAFGLDAEITASFLSGKLSITGAAKYLNSKVNSDYEAAMAYKYSETTHYEAISQDKINAPDFTDLMDKFPEATHVVTKITYGASIIFSFKDIADHVNDTTEIMGKMKIMLKIGPVSAIGQAELNLTNDEFNDTKSYSCDFSGDINLDKVPTTYKDAMEALAQVPALINETTTVPVEVQLVNISVIYGKDMSPTKILRLIKKSKLVAYRNRIQEFDEFDRQIGNIQKECVYNKLKNVRKQFDQFKAAFHLYRITFNSKMAKYLAQAKKEQVGEDEMEKLLTSNGLKDFREWMFEKKSELAVFEKLCTWDRDLVLTEDGQVGEMLYGEKKYVLLLVIQVYPESDPYIDCLIQMQRNPDASECKKPLQYVGWYNRTTGYQINYNVQMFMSTVDAILDTQNFSLIKASIDFAIVEREAVVDKQEELSTIELYLNGALHEKDLQLPFFDGSNVDPKFNCSHLVLTWTAFDTIKNSIILDDSFTVRYRNANSTVWRHILNVKNKMVAIKVAELSNYRDLRHLTVEVQLLKDCIVGYCTFYSKNYTVAEIYNYVGFKSLSVPGWCLQKCGMTDNCTRNEICEEEKEQGYVIATKCRAVDECQFLYGSHFKTADTVGSSVIVEKYSCCQYCRKNPLCKGFTWHPVRIVGNNSEPVDPLFQHKCILFSEMDHQQIVWNNAIIGGYVKSRLNI